MIGFLRKIRRHPILIAFLSVKNLEILHPRFPHTEEHPLSIIFLVGFALRLLSLAISIRNERRLKAADTVEHGHRNTVVLATLHFAFYFSALAEGFHRNVQWNNFAPTGAAVYAFSLIAPGRARDARSVSGILKLLRAKKIRNPPITMSNPAVSIHPYFNVNEGTLDDAKAVLAQCVERTATEVGNQFCEFTLNGNIVFCRESYIDADAAVAHVQNVGDLIEKLLTLSTLERIELHGPAAELEKLKEPLAALNPTYFAYGVEK